MRARQRIGSRIHHALGVSGCLAIACTNSRNERVQWGSDSPADNPSPPADIAWFGPLAGATPTTAPAHAVAPRCTIFCSRIGDHYANRHKRCVGTSPARNRNGDCDSGCNVGASFDMGCGTVDSRSRVFNWPGFRGGIGRAIPNSLRHAFGYLAQCQYLRRQLRLLHFAAPITQMGTDWRAHSRFVDSRHHPYGAGFCVENKMNT